jgi:hypothetical protein
MGATSIPLGKTAGFGVLLWLAGFVWGTIVFMTPAMKEMPSVPYVSRYPAISAPLLMLFPLLAWWFARACVKDAADKTAAGLQIGFLFAGINFVLDVLVLVIAFKSGIEYFYFASIWVAYLLLVLVPWAAGRKLSASA